MTQTVQMVGGIADGKEFALLENHYEWNVAHSPNIDFFMEGHEPVDCVEYKVDVYRRMINNPNIFIWVRTEVRT